MFWRTGFVILLGAIIGGGALSVHAQDATPEPASVAGGEAVTIVLVDRATNRTTVDSGEPGSSIGDMLIWGPNALYDESNTTDTGATVTGVCVWFTADGDCLAYETMVFPDGSTLETQGIHPGASEPSVRTIVGGSGQYLGAAGTVHIEPSEDMRVWTRTITITWATLDGQPMA